MANKGTWPASSSAAGSGGDAIDANRATADALWIGIDGVPTGGSLIDGVCYWVSISGDEYERRAYVNGAEVPLFIASKTLSGLKLAGPLNCNYQELRKAVLESLATGGLPTTEAAVWYDSSVDRGGYTGASSAQYYWGRYNLDGSTVRRIPCDFNVDKAATPATQETAVSLLGNEWTLDAVAEELNVVARDVIPEGFTAAHDLTLELRVMLLSAETASDLIKMTGDWRTLAVGDNPSKAATTVPDSDTDVGSDVTQYDIHYCTFTIDHDASGNVIQAGDQFVATVNLRAIDEVAGIIVFGADLLVPVLNGED